MTIRQGNKIIAGNINVEDYNTLQNKPQINSVELSGNKTLEELGIQASGDYALKSTTLAGYGITDGLSTSQITNCITKIPQDIKLELSEDGTLTLKAGSKVYNGTGNAININSDISSTNGGTSTGSKLLFTDGTGFGAYLLEQCVSSDTNPGAGYQIWFNTSDKIIYRDDNKTGNFKAMNWSLPIAVVKTSNSKYTSIEQIFNGFGFIDSTFFILPNVEGLAPNGRNEDGSLKNTKIISSKVWIRDFTNQTNMNGYMCLATTGIGFNPNLKYIDEKNYLIDITTNNINNDRFEISYISIDTTGRIIGFKPKYNLQIVDRSDTQWISSQGKPSNKWIDLTLGASGTRYTAPANGWVCFRKQATAIGQFAELVTGKLGSICYSGQATTVAEIYITVSKGEQFIPFYSVAGETELFRFVYDEGFK